MITVKKYYLIKTNIIYDFSITFEHSSFVYVRISECNGLIIYPEKKKWINSKIFNI